MATTNQPTSKTRRRARRWRALPALGTLALAATAWPGAGVALAANQSDSCVSPTAQIADGFAGTTYVKLRIEQADPSHTWICFRIQDGAANNLGGKVVITSPGASAGVPTQDANYNGCGSTGNQVPGDHPMQSGSIGDPQEPPFVPYLIDTFANTSGAMFCLRVGDVQQRVVVPSPSAQAPDVAFLADTPAVPAPTPESPPAGYPSGTCQAGLGGTHDRAMNADIGNDLHAWLEAWRPGLSTAYLCLRLQGTLPGGGPVAAGGALSLDASGFPGLSPVVTPGTNMGVCPINIFSNDPNEIEIKRSPQGANPASLCVRIGTDVTTLTGGVTGTLTPPNPDWAEDPDSV